MPTQQSDAVGTALRQENLKGYITALGEYDLPRSGLVLHSKINRRKVVAFQVKCKVFRQIYYRNSLQNHENSSTPFYTGGAIVTITLISLIAKIPCGSRISEIKTSPGLAGNVNPSLPKNSPSP